MDRPAHPVWNAKGSARVIAIAVSLVCCLAVARSLRAEVSYTQVSPGYGRVRQQAAPRPALSTAGMRASANFARLPVSSTGAPMRGPSSGGLTQGYRLVIGPEGVILSISGAQGRSPLRFQDRDVEQPGARGSVFGIRLSGANPTPSIKSYGEPLTRGKASKAAIVSKVKLHAVYPEIDWIWHGSPDQLEYDFMVKPGGDPKKIKLAFEGVDRIELGRKGELLLHTPGGTIREAAPLAYQETRGQRKNVPVRYVLQAGGQSVGVEVGAFDRKVPLIID